MIRPDNYSVCITDECTASVDMTFTSSFPYFKGHFPTLPLLPGVVQLGLAVEFAKEIFNIQTCNCFPVIKFVNPVLPDDRLLLKLSLNKEKKSVNFDYVIQGNNLKASSGRIRIL
ncbi:MAG: hypothetical protein ACI4UM_09085 [Succinivibrio sp.]